MQPKSRLSDPVRILFLGSCPNTADILKVDLEFRAIRIALRSEEDAGQIKTDQRTALRVEDLREALQRFQPDIVHFSGHGTRQSEIVLNDSRGGGRRIASVALAELFALLKGRIHLVVFNACHSASLAEAIASHIDCTIGMNDTIADEAAIKFAGVFYQAIGWRETVQKAFDLGRNELRLKSLEGAGVPVLFSRTGVDPGRIVFPGGHTSGDAGPGPLTLTSAGLGAFGEGAGQVGPEAAPPTAPRVRSPVQVLFLLDLASDNHISQDEIEMRLPDRRERRDIHRITDFGARRTPRGSALDFPVCADAVVRMVQEARARLASDGPPVHYYVAGHAALPVFAHLGMELSSWADVTLINRAKNGGWDVLPLGGATGSEEGVFFKVAKGLEISEPCDSDGRVAIFVSAGHPVPREAIRTFLRAHNEPLARIVELRAEEDHLVRVAKAGGTQVMAELVRAFERLPSALPHCQRAALFVAGPATLAFMAGRAMNTNRMKSVWVPNYEEGAYRFAASLPWIGPTRSRVGDAPSDLLARGAVLQAIADRVAALQRTLQAEDLPPALAPEEAKRMIDRVQKAVVDREPQAELVEISAVEGKVAFGRSLLEAIRRVPDAARARIGLTVFLHALFRLDQGDAHDGAEHGGLALEEAEYWAYTMAVVTLSRWEIRRGGDEAREKTSEFVRRYIDAVLDSDEAEERFEGGEQRARLREGQLRRVLVWSLQKVRAATLKRPEDIWRLFNERLVVELAPLRWRLDERFERCVEAPLSNAALTLALGRRLIRAHSPKLGPGEMLAAVRAFDRGALEEAFRGVVGRHLPDLSGWER
jgi:SMODS-associated and fused to various effectors sensor domain/CHAT domain